MKPRLGILDFCPIPYKAPLYRRLASLSTIDVDVLYLADKGYRGRVNPKFGVPVAYGIELLGGYEHSFLGAKDIPTLRFGPVRKLDRWLAAHEVVVIHGYTNPWMICAMTLCRSRSIPYLMRGDSLPGGHSDGLRRVFRDGIARAAVSGSSGGLAIGKLNEEFYRRYKAPQVFFTPFSVDDARFSRRPIISRSELLAQWGLCADRPVIMYCGSMYPGKRPLDLVDAIRLLRNKVTVIFVGDGELADQIRSGLMPGEGVVTGFVNQTELPAYYHASDIIVVPSQLENWGFVLNEAMVVGTFPVVSDRVGAAPDLVADVGEIYPCGDVERLAIALDRALLRVCEPHIRERVRQHVARYSLDRSVAGFEEATLAVSRRHGP